MTTTTPPEHVLIIDCQAHWRQHSMEALEAEGFSVRTLDNYDYPPPTGIPPDDMPDLVILGCASIGRPEVELIERLLNEQLHLVVLSTALPWHDMRRLFLAGADDVTDKPYNSADLLKIVSEALENIPPRDSYQAAKQKGAL